jgi:hypothetical protein
MAIRYTFSITCSFVWTLTSWLHILKVVYTGRMSNYVEWQGSRRNYCILGNQATFNTPLDEPYVGIHANVDDHRYNLATIRMRSGLACVCLPFLLF